MVSNQNSLAKKISKFKLKCNQRGLVRLDLGPIIVTAKLTSIIGLDSRQKTAHAR